MVSVSQKSCHEKLGLIRFIASSLVCLLSSSLLIDQEVSLVAAASPEVRVFNWEVEYMFWKPDCVENIVMGINGQYPAPTIRARAGDVIVVNLTNNLHTEAVVIHWHGIRQLGTPWADGTASISQCPINPGETFVYTFKVDKAGTYFYHGHYGMQRSAGLYGALIVDVEEGQKEPFDYDEELILLLSDWWHQSTHKQEVSLSSNPFRWIGEPQSLLINGRGRYGCSHLAEPLGKRRQCKITEDEQCSPHILSVLPNKIYRLRIASTTSLASLNLQIGKHMMMLVEADGNYVRPKLLDDIDVYSGESYSVLIKTNQDPSINYWISISVRGRKPETPQGLAILSYNHPNKSRIIPPSAPPVSPKWDDYEHSKHFIYNILATADLPKPPFTRDRRIILLNTQNRINGVIKWSINNISLVLPATPYLGSIKHQLKGAFDSRIPAENFPRDYDISKPPVNPNATRSSGVFTIQYGETIDVILQNANALKEGVSEIHPWHLHGHDFWVLGYGEGKFSEEAHESTLNLEDPPLRNTAVVFPYGWTAIRFVADNPGVWAFHCHIEPHLHMGMGVIFAESVERIKDIPKEALACGLIAKVLMKNSTALIKDNSTRRDRPSGKG